MIISRIGKLQDKSLTVGVVGLRYEGLPLAVELGTQISGNRFDINEPRIKKLQPAKDRTRKLKRRSSRSLNIFVAHPA